MNKHSGIARDAISSGKAGRMVATYMTLSYAYYQLEKSLVPDADYDQLCKALNQDDVWEQANAHQHAKFIRRDDLAAGTGYRVRYYPAMVVSNAHHLIAEAGL